MNDGIGEMEDGRREEKHWGDGGSRLDKQHIISHPEGGEVR